MTPFKPVADGVRIAVRLTPKASRNAIAGMAPSGQGETVLKVMVTAVPEAGKANEALIKLLAKEWGVAKSSISLVAGATDRNKIVHVAGDAADLMARLSHTGITEPNRSLNRPLPEDEDMTKARIIDGKGFALSLRTRIAAQVAALKEAHGLEPGLAVVLVGDDPASQVYVRNKGQATLAAGMRSFEHKLPDTVDQATLVALVERAERATPPSTASWCSCRCRARSTPPP